MKDSTPEHRETLAALDEARSLVKTILDNTLDGIITIDERGAIVSFNKAAESLFGYGAPEVVGRNVALLMPEPFHSEHDSYLQQYLKTGQEKIIGVGREVAGRRKDGTVFPVFLAVGKAFQSGMDRYFTGMVRDLSREKSYEAQLRQAQKMEAIGTLAGGIAHDFNNILGGLLGYVELMLEEAAPGSDQHGDLLEMFKACGRGKELVGQILTFSRRNPPKREPVHLDAIVADSMRFLRATIPSTVDIRQQLQTGGPTVVADATQIHQVLLNLCTNAYQAMGAEGGLLDVSLKEVKITADTAVNLPPGNYYELAVRDTGAGMDEATKARMFEPFFTRKPVGEGTGMGLAVVHGIVRQHNGAISCVSKPGAGTTVTVQLPAEQVKEPDSLGKTPVLKRGKERILLIDDDRLLLKVETRILANQGYRVEACSDGSEALQKFRASPDDFNLVITDQNMPKLTGSQLAQKILEIRASIPVLLITGFADLISMEEAKAIGIRDILMKPTQKQELLEKIQSLLAH